MADNSINGLLHPGVMGAAVGQCLTAAGHTVLWHQTARASRSMARAEAAGLTDAGTPRQLAAEAAVILSVCPPHAALDVAWAVHGFTGLCLDANAISPGAVGEVAQLINDNGGGMFDGGIIGLPPTTPASARLYLSGPGAGRLQELFAGTALQCQTVAGPATAASAVKAYAA